MPVLFFNDNWGLKTLHVCVEKFPHRGYPFSVLNGLLVVIVPSANS